jgi:hypothetical protein
MPENAILSPAAGAIVRALEQRDFLRDPAFDEPVAHICQVCRGWSTVAHYAFFKSILDCVPWAQHWLILGVYQGRDIAFIQAARRKYHLARKLDITGIDLFSDGPCNDWPEAMRGKTWEEAGMGPPPTKTQAWDNLGTLDLHYGVVLREQDDALALEALAGAGCVYDVVYIDTAHDFATVARQISQVRGVIHPATIICGDDWTPRETWDVAGAVRAGFTAAAVFAQTIWLSDAGNLRPPQ